MGPFSWNGCQTLHTQSFWWGLSLTCPLLESYFIPTRVIGSIAYTTKDMLQLFKYNTILSICVPFKAHIYDPIMWRPWRWDYPFVTYFFLLQCIDSIMLLRLHFCSKRSFKSSTTLLTFPQKVRAIVERDLPFSLPLSIYQFSGIWDITQVTQYTRNITCLKCTTQKYNWYWHEDWGADELSLIPVAQIPFGWLVFR